MHSGMVHRFILTQTTHRYSYAFRNGNPDNTDALWFTDILTQTTHRYSYAFRNGSQIYINPDNT